MDAAHVSDFSFLLHFLASRASAACNCGRNYRGRRSRVAFWAFTADRKGCSSVTEWTLSLNAWNKQQLFGWFGAVQMSFNGTLGVDEKAPPVREYSPLMARTLLYMPKVKMQQLSWHFRRQTAGLHPRKTCLTFEFFFTGVKHIKSGDLPRRNSRDGESWGNRAFKADIPPPPPSLKSWLKSLKAATWQLSLAFVVAPSGLSAY